MVVGLFVVFLFTCTFLTVNCVTFVHITLSLVLSMGFVSQEDTASRHQ